MEHKNLVDKIVKRDQTRRKRIEAAGIEYEYPEFVSFKPCFLSYIINHLFVFYLYWLTV